MKKIIGIIEYNLMEDEHDTEETLIKEAMKEFNYEVHDKEMYAGRLTWKVVED